MVSILRCSLMVCLLAGMTAGIGQNSAAGKAGDANRIVEVGSDKQLFVDETFFETSANISLRLHPAVKTGEHTLVSDRPWEDATLNWFSVMDDEGTYRMWYECYDVTGWPTPDDTSFCYATSKDGIQWNKPSLGVFSYESSTDNNILFRQIGTPGAHSRVHGAGVFKDPTAAPEARYKAVSQGLFEGYEPPYRIAGMYSADGLRWTRLPAPICDVFADSQYSAWRDPVSGDYVLFGRVAGRGRAIGRAASASFEHVTPLELVLDTEARHPPDCDLYNPSAFKYPCAENVYLMFPSLYHHNTDTLDIHLAVSRDGIHWSWPECGKPFVSLGHAGDFDSGSLYMGQGYIRSEKELWMYYSGSPLKHNEVELDTLAKPQNRRIYSRCVVRLDGFVSVDAGDTEGYFITPPLRFEGARLVLNCRTEDSGSVRAGLLDAEGNPIPGWDIADCAPVTGDHVATTVTWHSGTGLDRFQNTPVKLAFTLRNASLYAFQFMR